jgi:hypothetical protein
MWCTHLGGKDEDTMGLMRIGGVNQKDVLAKRLALAW